MANASFCPLCGDIISDGCEDEYGEVSYTPCACVAEQEENAPDELLGVLGAATAFILGSGTSTEVSIEQRRHYAKLVFYEDMDVESAYLSVRAEYDDHGEVLLRYYADAPLADEPVTGTARRPSELWWLGDWWRS